VPLRAGRRTVALHAGLQPWLGWSFGTVVIVVGFAVLLLWIPLRQWPGLGTIANAVVIGIATDATLAIVPPASGWPASRGLLVGWLLGGTVGIGTVLYALTIGPLVQFFLPLVTVRLAEPGPDEA
jgi:uncharacterized membrane protein YczE